MKNKCIKCGSEESHKVETNFLEHFFNINRDNQMLIDKHHHSLFQMPVAKLNIEIYICKKCGLIEKRVSKSDLDKIE